MANVNRWDEDGVIRANTLMRVKLTLTSKSTLSGANAVVGDYYEFNCKSKNLPRSAECPTWNDVTDNPNEPTGYAYSGKSPQLEPIELITRTPVSLVFDDLFQHKTHGDVFTVTFTYDDPLESSVFTITVPNCKIIGLEPQGGETSAGSQTTIKILPEGGSADNMPSVTATLRSAG